MTSLLGTGIVSQKRSCGLGKATLPFSSPVGCSLLFSDSQLLSFPDSLILSLRVMAVWPWESHSPSVSLVFALPGSESLVLSPRLSHFLQPLCPPPGPPP